MPFYAGRAALPCPRRPRPARTHRSCRAEGPAIQPHRSRAGGVARAQAFPVSSTATSSEASGAGSGGAPASSAFRTGGAMTEVSSDMTMMTA